MTRKIYLLVDGNFRILGKDMMTYEVSIDKATSQISTINSEADVSKEIRPDNAVYEYLSAYDEAKHVKTNEFIPVEMVGRFQTYVSKKDFTPYIQISETEIKSVTKELVDQLKTSMLTVKNLKLELVSAPMDVELGNRVLLYGPTGTGKTYDFLSAAEQLIKAGKLDKDGIEVVTISDGFEDIDFLAHIVPTDKGIMHVETRVVQLFREAAKGKKIAILLDELNRGNKAFLNLVLKMLDAVDGKTYTLNNFVKNESIVVPIENVLFFATMNLGSKYVGTTALDEALLDRFNVVQFKGYDEKVEEEILKKGFGKNKTAVKKMVKYVRDQNSAGYIRSPISTRGVKMWAEAFMNSDGSDDALIDTFRSSLLFRLISVNDIGIPNSEEQMIIEKKLNELFIKKVTTSENEQEDEKF